MTSDPRNMDARLKGLPKLHRGVNGGQNSRPHEADPLQFLSQEEQECIQFFEKTMDSLDESLEPVNVNPSPLDGRPGPKDQDIIYLVHPEPDLVQNKPPTFDPNRPDFQSMMQNPESHFEMRPRRDALDGLPEEYNPPLPNSSYGPTDHHSSYHPPGSIPTPVLIAQQIAGNRGGGASNLHPSSFLRSHNQDHDKPLSPVGDPQARHGAPTSASRFPTNISVTPHGNKEGQNQTLVNVNLQERRSQMLANLSGAPNTLLQEDPQPAQEPSTRNAPAGSISFKDPMPDQSRMEALSKLGLNRNTAMSGGRMPSLDVTDGTPQSPPTDKGTTGKPPQAGAAQTPDLEVPKGNVATPRPSPIPTERKPEIQRSDSLRRFDERNRLLSLSSLSVAQNSAYLPPPLDDMASLPPPPDVASHELNRYGGKSINVNAMSAHRAMSGAPNAVLQEDPQPAPGPATQNAPAGSISFKDPLPDQSRMEALSKLGLNRNQAMSGGRTPLLDVLDGTPESPLTERGTSTKLPEAGAAPITDLEVPKGNVATPQPSPIPTERKPEIQRSDSLKRFDERNRLLSLSSLSVAQNSAYLPPPLDDMASFPPPPEVASHELNRYRGKSINVNPPLSTRREPAATPSHEPKVPLTGLSNPSQFNPYGGKTKVMNPAPAPGTRSNLPDLLGPHVDRSRTLPARSEPPPPAQPTELNSYGGKSRTFNPASGLNRPPDRPARSFKAPPPAPAPRPGRHSHHGGAGAPQRPVPRASSPEHRRKSASAFRPQGITVQFSGRGAMDESRRQALRKLGLLKES
ncbi:uncharacterized protein proser2 isoform 1-T4 [Spinachia spinachia]